MIRKITIKSFATVVCLFFSFVVLAQNDRPVKFGFDLGLGYANQWGNAYDAYHKTGLFSFTFGADIDIRVSEKQFIEVGANFNRKGCKIEGHQWVKDGGPWKFYTDKDKATINMFYLQVPVMYGLCLPIEDQVSWKLMVGPYFAFGLTGDRRNEYESYLAKAYNTLVDRESTVSTFNEEPKDFSFKRFDVGAKIQTGVTVDRVSYMIAYELGFFNTLREAENSDYGYKARNNSIMLIVSFRF